MAGKYFQIKMQILFVFEIQLGGVNSNTFYFHPYLGKIHILTHIFQMDFLAFNAFFVVFFFGGGWVCTKPPICGFHVRCSGVYSPTWR